MNLMLPLDKMTTAQKVEVMDMIWADLVRNDGAFKTSRLHKEILRERKAAVKAGTATYSDWSTARERLSDPLRREQQLGILQLKGKVRWSGNLRRLREKRLA